MKDKTIKKLLITKKIHQMKSNLKSHQENKKNCFQEA